MYAWGFTTISRGLVSDEIDVIGKKSISIRPEYDSLDSQGTGTTEHVYLNSNRGLIGVICSLQGLCPQRVIVVSGEECELSICSLSG